MDEIEILMETKIDRKVSQVKNPPKTVFCKMKLKSKIGPSIALSSSLETMLEANWEVACKSSVSLYHELELSFGMWALWVCVWDIITKYEIPLFFYDCKCHKKEMSLLLSKKSKNIRPGSGLIQGSRL
jgi:hypothetical protein